MHRLFRRGQRAAIALLKRRWLRCRLGTRNQGPGQRRPAARELRVEPHRLVEVVVGFGQIVERTMLVKVPSLQVSVVSLAVGVAYGTARMRIQQANLQLPGDRVRNLVLYGEDVVEIAVVLP